MYRDVPRVPGLFSLFHLFVSGTQPLAIARGAHTVQWVCANGTYTPGATCTGWDQILAAAKCTRASCVCNFDVLAPAAAAATEDGVSGAVISSNQQLLAPPGELHVVRDAVVTAAVGPPTADGLIPVTVSASATAVLVTLTTLASGVFSDNAFLLTPDAPAKLLFTPYGPTDAVALKASLRIAHLAQYM